MANNDNILQPGESMVRGETISSNNGNYDLVMQDDGNLVLYRDSDDRALWASGTHGDAVSQVVMQHDGNLVVYGFPNPLWASDTWGKPGSYLVVQDDGNVVIYDPLYDPARPIWSTDTWMY